MEGESGRREREGRERVKEECKGRRVRRKERMKVRREEEKK